MRDEETPMTRTVVTELSDGEELVVEEGLQCVKCHRVYPIVSDIPVMLVDEAFDQP